MKTPMFSFSKTLHPYLISLAALALALFAGGAFIIGAGAAKAGEAPQAPAATTNVCDLPGALIDTGDLAYEGDDIQVIGCQGTINGEHAFNSLTVQNGTLVHSETLTMSLTINTDALIAADGSINIAARGYPGGPPNGGAGGGPGGGQPGDAVGGGGGHGGNGGGRAGYSGEYQLAGLAYGDVYRPVTRGSGGAGCAANSYCHSTGGYGGAGGGAVHLNVGGTLTVDGNINANGGSAILVSGIIPGSGGAGGSIWLEAATFNGSGQILANGGNGAGLRKIGGGGGRIAVYYSSNSFSGTLSAQGGQTDLDPGYTDIDYAAGAGTIYLRSTGSTAGQMIIANRDTENATQPLVATTPLDGGLVTASEPHNFTTFDIRGAALVSTTRPVTIAEGSAAYPGLWAIQGRFEGVTTTLGSGLSISVTSGTAAPTVGQLRTAFDGPLTMDDSQDLLIGLNGWVELREPLTVDEVIVRGYGRLGHIPYREGIQPKLDLTANTLTINANGQINVGARGYPGALANSNLPGGGPGGGTNSSGGGYGGIGGGLEGGAPTAVPPCPSTWGPVGQAAVLIRIAMAPVEMAAAAAARCI